MDFFGLFRAPNVSLRGFFSFASSLFSFMYFVGEQDFYSCVFQREYEAYAAG